MATIKKSNTTRIFENNNFGRFLPILSNENLIEKLLNSKEQGTDFESINNFLKNKRVPLGNGEKKIDPGRIAELLQSISIYGKYTNEIINEIADIEGLGKSFKITYISPEEFKQLTTQDTIIPDFLNEISVLKSLKGTDSNKTSSESNTEEASIEIKINDIEGATQLPYTRNVRQPGLSAFQVINPEFRGCFKHSQELDLFFNMISTLDMSMAIPFVNAEFLIPDRVVKTSSTSDVFNDKKYLTTSLNNFILGDDYFQTSAANNNQSKYDTNVNDAAKAINGDWYKDEYSIVRNSVKTSSTEQQSQIKKTYQRQSLNNAIFFAPQTMVNADYNIADNPNAIVDKFRPFMSITNLSFDVRPTKGLMFYKTATLDLVLYDKARMSQVAAFIKPELLNSVSSEIILEYGWQHNLGDQDYYNPNNLRSVTVAGQEITYLENPIGEFINSLKVREKYIIVNSSYTINQNGTVNINLSLAMKGPAELRGLSFKIDQNMSKLKANLQSAIDELKSKINTGYIEQDTSGTRTSKSIDIGNLDSELVAGKLDETELKKIETSIKNQSINDSFKKRILKNIKDVSTSLKAYNTSNKAYIDAQFGFLNTHDAKTNDPFVDYEWWNNYLGTIVRSKIVDDEIPSNTQIVKGNWNGTEWISLGKIILNIIGERLITENNKYDEVQFVFYNLNGKAIRASFLNIASIPVDKVLFEKRMKNLIENATKLSAEGVLDFILNIAVNQKAAGVYGLGEYFKFTSGNSSEIVGQDIANEAERKNLINSAHAGIKSTILRQYYGDDLDPNAAGNTELKSNDPSLQALNEIQSGVFDLTFNVGRVVMNFDSTYHENDSNSSILRISFYDENDNPFESLTEFMSKFHNNDYSHALSAITTLRGKINKIKSSAAQINKALPKEDDKKAKKNKSKDKPAADTKATPKPVQTANTPAPTQKEINENFSRIENIIKKDVGATVYELITKQLIILKDENGVAIPIDKINRDTPLDNDQIKKISINIKDNNKIKSFQNMKSLFKTMMPSLTFGQSNSALISGNITTNQNAQYSTVLLMKQNGEEAEKPPSTYDIEVFSQATNSPLWVMPAQASAQIIGCPIINFSQLIFLDFNTGTSIDNMYFINGIRHSISPGSFKTDLTLVQKDVYSQFEAGASAIAEFLKAAGSNEFTNQLNSIKNRLEKENKPPVIIIQGAGGGTKATPSQAASTQPINNYQISFKINYDKKI